MIHVLGNLFNNIFGTRMHSSRMHTVHNRFSCLPGGIPGLGVPGTWGVLQGGVWSRGCLVWDVSAPGGVSARGGGIPACIEADPPPPVSRMTDRCKNITFTTSIVDGNKWKCVNVNQWLTLISYKCMDKTDKYCNFLTLCYSQSCWMACRHTERGLEVVLYSMFPIDIFPFCRERPVTKEPAVL